MPMPKQIYQMYKKYVSYQSKVWNEVLQLSQIENFVEF